MHASYKGVGERVQLEGRHFYMTASTKEWIITGDITLPIPVTKVASWLGDHGTIKMATSNHSPVIQDGKSSKNHRQLFHPLWAI